MIPCIAFNPLAPPDSPCPRTEVTARYPQIPSFRQFRNLQIQLRPIPASSRQQRLRARIQPQLRLVQKSARPVLLQPRRILLRQPGECHDRNPRRLRDPSSTPSTRPARSSSAAACPAGSVPAFLSRQFQRALAVVRCAHLISRPRQRTLRRYPQELAVIDQQNFCHPRIFPAPAVVRLPVCR